MNPSRFGPRGKSGTTEGSRQSYFTEHNSEPEVDSSSLPQDPSTSFSSPYLQPLGNTGK
jgi:hypothetical protein